jgi:serine phosphatase RsbU (regulator of sigma subunit)
MVVFQVSSESIPSALPPPRRRRRRIPREWDPAISIIRSIVISALLFGLPLVVWPFSWSTRKARKVLYAFSASLREVINLEQLRESTLSVVQEMMQPAIVTLWVRQTARQQEAAVAPVAPAQTTCQVAGDDPLLAYLVSHPGVLEVERLQLDSEALRDLDSQGAEILLPLVSQGELLGLLILWPRARGQRYTLDSFLLLSSLAQQVAQSLRVVELVQEQQAQAIERERIEQELRTARKIQQSLLPTSLPDPPGWQIATYYHPAREVGGDFYDFLPFEDGRLGIVIGDVSGKGIPAAMLMSSTRSLLRAASQMAASPGEVLARVNELLCADTLPGMFVTCFYASLDPVSGRLRYANAGHELPYRRSGEGVCELYATGMPLGLMSGMQYEEQEALVTAGEHMLLYSDGLVESHNPDREMFGFPRLKQLISASAFDAPGDGFINLLLQELKCFTGEGWEQEDDVTLVVLQRTAIPS